MRPGAAFNSCLGRVKIWADRGTRLGWTFCPGVGPLKRRLCTCSLQINRPCILSSRVRYLTLSYRSAKRGKRRSDCFVWYFEILDPLVFPPFALPVGTIHQTKERFSVVKCPNEPWKQTLPPQIFQVLLIDVLASGCHTVCFATTGSATVPPANP